MICARCLAPGDALLWRAADGCWFDDALRCWRDQAGRPQREMPEPHGHGVADEALELDRVRLGIYDVGDRPVALCQVCAESLDSSASAAAE